MDRDDAGRTTEHEAERELTPRERSMLDFEAAWWQLDESREEAIRARFQCTSDEYYAELHRVLELPGAMAHDPLVVRRFHRRRNRRRQALVGSGRASDSRAAANPAPIVTLPTDIAATEANQ